MGNPSVRAWLPFIHVWLYGLLRTVRWNVSPDFTDSALRWSLIAFLYPRMVVDVSYNYS